MGDLFALTGTISSAPAEAGVASGSMSLVADLNERLYLQRKFETEFTPVGGFPNQIAVLRTSGGPFGRGADVVMVQTNQDVVVRLTTGRGVQSFTVSSFFLLVAVHDPVTAIDFTQVSGIPTVKLFMGEKL